MAAAGDATPSTKQEALGDEKGAAPSTVSTTVMVLLVASSDVSGDTEVMTGGAR